MNPFQIMSEPIRRRIVEILASGEHTSGNIADVIMSEYGVGRSAVQKHLAILLRNGWVDYRQEESAHFSYLEDRVWRRLDAEVKHLKRLWKRRIGTLSGNDSYMQFREVRDVRPHARAVEGTVKGLRGRGRRNDPWVPRPHRRREPDPR